MDPFDDNNNFDDETTATNFHDALDDGLSDQVCLDFLEREGKGVLRSYFDSYGESYSFPVVLACNRSLFRQLLLMDPEVLTLPVPTSTSGELAIHEMWKLTSENLELLMERFPDTLRLVDANGHTLFHVLCLHQCWELLVPYLNLHPDLLSLADKVGNYPLHLLTLTIGESYYIDDHEAVRTFYERYVVSGTAWILEKENADGWTPWHLLVRSLAWIYGYPSRRRPAYRLLSKLLEHRPDGLRICNRRGKPPSFAIDCRWGPSDDVFRNLCSAFPDLVRAQRKQTGESLLHHVIRKWQNDSRTLRAILAAYPEAARHPMKGNLPVLHFYLPTLRHFFATRDDILFLCELIVANPEVTSLPLPDGQPLLVWAASGRKYLDVVYTVLSTSPQTLLAILK